MNRNLGNEIFTVKNYLAYLNEIIPALLDTDRKVNLIDYYSSRVFPSYSITALGIKEYSDAISLSELHIDDYLCSIHNYFEFERLSRKIQQVLLSIYTNVSSDFHLYTEAAESLKRLGIDKTFNVDAHIQEVAQLNEELHKMYQAEDALYKKVYALVPFTRLNITDEQVQFVVSEYRIFVKENGNRIYDKIRSIAMKFKKKRSDKLSREHWTKLADMEDEIIAKVIKGEPINDGRYDDFFSPKDLMEFSKHKDVLEYLNKTSDDELLYNFERAMTEYDMVCRINEDMVYYFFTRIHIENLIKCELFDNLKEEYEAFLGDREVDAAPVDNDPAEATDMAPEGLINKRIDEAKLINFIRDYTEGPNKSNYFDKKSYWLSVYIVLRQNIEQLDNKPIFLPSSRPKFVEWINEHINPSLIPCNRGVLDAAPAYFRDERNYPWTLNEYLKSNGKQESTYNGYSMVADYFQQHIIEGIKDFLKD
jgi:hypothetical protein